MSISWHLQFHFRKYPDKKPLIVFDHGGLVYHSWLPKDETLCGFRSKAYRKRAEEFFEKLVATGAELVFFMDGAVQIEKYETWFTRKNDIYADQLEIIDEINQLTPLTEIICQNYSKVRRFGLISDLLASEESKFGSIITTMEVECDLAIAAYATENEALAVFADDSDFLIFPGNWRFFSYRHLNCAHMTTQEYNRVNLRKHLQLTDEQMPLLATLNGNDFMHFDDVKQFHYSLTRTTDRFQNISLFIRDLICDLNSEELPLNLSKAIFQGRWTDFIEAIQASLASYDYKSVRKSVKK